MEDRLQSLAILAKSLGDENRLRILFALKNGRKPVSRIVAEVNLSQPLVSHHLKELKRSLLVRMERQGPFVFYEMADPAIFPILQELDALARQLLADRRTF
jgi:DNA-binding transcriptional ArsR family regulator